MLQTVKVAYRNLLRYSRRSLLTSLLVVIGVVAVLLFMAVAGSFKALMIGQITDSMLGHVQIHRKGYVASIDNSPLNLNLKAHQAEELERLLQRQKSVAAHSGRLKFGGMLSNFTETSNIRLNGIDLEQELQVAPLLAQRIAHQNAGGPPSLVQGEIWLPETLAKGMKIALGAQVVLVATNAQGSVNGIPLVVSGIVGVMTGPGGRDGYLNLADARRLLRIQGNELNEITLRLKHFDQLDDQFSALNKELSSITNSQGKSIYEIHSWKKLSPFSNIADIIDLLTLFVNVILVTIVLVSVMNVMLMAVYERVGEIGMMAAIGVGPGKIRALFMAEGLFLGVFGVIVGTGISLAVIWYLNWQPLEISFGRQERLILSPGLSLREVAGTALVVMGVSALASLQPAFKASRLEPIDALRHV